MKENYKKLGRYSIYSAIGRSVEIEFDETSIRGVCSDIIRDPICNTISFCISSKNHVFPEPDSIMGSEGDRFILCYDTNGIDEESQDEKAKGQEDDEVIGTDRKLENFKKITKEHSRVRSIRMSIK